MRFDRFDLLSLAAVALLFAGILQLGLGARSGAPAKALHGIPADEPTRKALVLARTLLESGHAAESIDRLGVLETASPAVAEIHFTLGRAFLERRDYPSCLREFRLSLALDPDYADPKSGKFAGRMLKPVVRDGLDRARSGLAKAPGDPLEQAAREDGLFLQRMLAGGCG